MGDNVWFLHQIKRENGVFSKGIVVKESYAGACQSMYAYLGAYGFDNQQSTDYVCCFVTDFYGNLVVNPVVWWRQPEQIEEQQEGGNE